jgi:hypothetical protein
MYLKKYLMGFPEQGVTRIIHELVDSDKIGDNDEKE